jgi:hypothetical protein
MYTGAFSAQGCMGFPEVQYGFMTSPNFGFIEIINLMSIGQFIVCDMLTYLRVVHCTIKMDFFTIVNVFSLYLFQLIL